MTGDGSDAGFGPNESGGPIRQKRGTPFPQVSLPEAVALVKEVGAYGSDHSIVSFASYLGHESANSGPFRQKVAAFRDWKLVTGTGDHLSLTDLAKRIAHPTDPETERAALRQTFENAPVFVKVYESVAKGRDLDLSSIANMAISTYGVQPKLKEKFIASFRDSAVIAGFATLTEEGRIRFQGPTQSPRSGGDSDDRRTNELGTADSGVIDGRGLVNLKPVLRQSWSTFAAELTFEIRSSQALPATAFGQVAKVILEIEKLKEQLDHVAK